MKVVVTSKNKVHDEVKRHGATHVISLLDPGDRLFMTPRIANCSRLHLSCEDVLGTADHNAPTLELVERLLEFGRNIPEDAVVVVHCFAGVSRSTAAAAALMAQELKLQGHADPVGEALRRLTEQRPEACPNPVISDFADRLLGFDGAFHEACENVANAKMLNFFG